MPELRISTDKVCDFIEAAREVAGLVPPTTDDRTATREENEGDDSKLVTIEEYPDDQRREQMVEFIAGLNIDEQTDLLALIRLGRGDFDIEDWDSGLAAAGDSIAAKEPEFMIGDEALPDYLGAGLEAFGRDCS